MDPEFFASSGRETSFFSGIVPRATPSLSIPFEEFGFPASFDKNPRLLVLVLHESHLVSVTQTCMASCHHISCKFSVSLAQILLGLVSERFMEIHGSLYNIYGSKLVGHLSYLFRENTLHIWHYTVMVLF